MTKRTSHLFSLFETLCETLSECARVERNAKPGSYAARKALEIRAASEPLAISCLDEEFGDKPMTLRATYASCSIALIDHLRSITDRRVHLGREEWSSIILSASPDTVMQMLDRGLFPGGGVLPMLHEIRSGKLEWIDILLEHIAPAVPLECQEIDDIIRLRYEGKSKSSLGDVAAVLKIQAQKFPVIIANEVGKSLRDGTFIHATAAFILAGIPLADILRTANPANLLCEVFIARLSSNHGALAVHRAFGSLESLLEDHAKRGRFLDQLHNDVRRRTLSKVT